MIKVPQQNELGKHDYSVIIYQEGDYNIAEDYNGRKVLESKTDGGKVLQEAIDELNWGGLIFAKRGTYPVLSTVEVKYGRTRIQGECHGRSFFRADTSLTNLIRVSDAVDYVTFEFLGLCGNNNVTNVIDCSKTTSAYAPLTFRNCHIYGATSKNILITNREEVLITRSIIGQYPQTSPYNIYANGMDGPLRLTEGTIVHNATTDSIYYKGRLLSLENAEIHTRDGASAHIRLTDGRLFMTDAWFENVNVRSVIGAGTWARVSTSNGYINGGFSGSFTFIRFNGDKISSTFTHDLDLTVAKSVTGNLDMDGSINITGKYHLYDLDDSVYKSNMITTGNETGTDAQQTIPHGLAATPSKVILWDVSWQAYPHQSAAANGTNLYLKAANGKYYGWQAEV